MNAKKMLVADADLTAQLLCGSALKKFGSQVGIATDGEYALRKFRR